MRGRREKREENEVGRRVRLTKKEKGSKRETEIDKNTYR